MLIVFKEPTISFLPNTPPQTMRNNDPYISITMVAKSTLPTSKKLNNRLWHGTSAPRKKLKSCTYEIGWLIYKRSLIIFGCNVYASCY